MDGERSGLHLASSAAPIAGTGLFGDLPSGPSVHLFGPSAPPPPAEDPAESTPLPEGERSKAAPKEEEELPPFITHTVRTTDTITGIMMRYNLRSEKQLRRYNDFPGSRIHVLRTLKIPRVPGSRPPPEVTKDDIAKDFAARNKVSVPEAKFYLSESQWDVAAARTMLVEDVEWESSRGSSAPAPGMEALEVELPAGGEERVAMLRRRRRHK